MVLSLKRFDMTTLEILIVIGSPFILILPFLLPYLLWRRKYVDRKTGWHKCGVCGAVTDPIYYEDSIFGRRYHCIEHLPTLNKKK
jgi:hypothetical protein